MCSSGDIFLSLFIERIQETDLFYHIYSVDELEQGFEELFTIPICKWK